MPLLPKPLSVRGDGYGDVADLSRPALSCCAMVEALLKGPVFVIALGLLLSSWRGCRAAGPTKNTTPCPMRLAPLAQNCTGR